MGWTVRIVLAGLYVARWALRVLCNFYFQLRSGGIGLCGVSSAQRHRPPTPGAPPPLDRYAVHTLIELTSDRRTFNIIGVIVQNKCNVINDLASWLTYRVGLALHVVYVEATVAHSCCAYCTLCALRAGVRVVRDAFGRLRLPL